MTGQQTVDLEKMNEREAAHVLTGLATELSAAKEYELRHEDYVMEMPQSGERFRGRENMRAFQEAAPGYSSKPSIRIDRVLVRDGLWVKEGVNDYGEGRVFHSTVIYELKDGRIWRDTRYYAEPFEAPAWRARWVEQMGPDAAPTPDGPATGERHATDEPELRRLVDRQWAMMRAGDLAGAHEWYADDCVVEWPQSGERIRGKENLLALREAYPAGVGFEVRRMTFRPDLVVGEYTVRYDGRPVNVVAIVEFGGGKVVRETHYFAEPFSPPEWRARWVETMEA